MAGFVPLDSVTVTNNLSSAPDVSENADLAMTLEESGNVEEQNLEYSSVVSYVKHVFERNKRKRYFDEHRWLECYRNFRGLYGDDVKFTDEEKSQAFIKVTKTKVLAAYAQLVDVLFSTNKFPISVESTPKPINVPDKVNFNPQAKGKTSPLATRPEIQDILGPLTDKLEEVREEIQIGAGTVPTSFTWEPAKIAAHNMEKKIQDQLEEAGADKSLRHFAFDMSLFGTGVFKGPFLLDKEYPKWNDQGTYEPVFKKMPEVSHVSIWDCYPDADARNIAESENFIERHRLSKTDLRKLKRRPGFRKESIEEAILQGPTYQHEYWEQILNDSNYKTIQDRWEVLEFWGFVDTEDAREAGLEIPDEYEDFDQIQVNIWVCADRVIRLVMNPFTPARIPYYAAPYELNPYSFFGVGVAENMLDTQLIMNGFMRLAIDNAALSSNLIFEVDESNLSPGQDLKLYPGKVFRRQAGAPGQAIFGNKIPNVTQECLLMFDKARQLSDESTGMPSYSHGMTGVMSVGRTASGMSMLMGAAAQNIKAVVKNIDDYLLGPLGEALFAFNMQFDFDPEIVGDLAVVAKGTESLMRNEIRAQKLMQLYQIALNPIGAPFLKFDYILRELAESLDLDPELVVNDPREAAIQAQTLGQMNQAVGQPPAGGPEGGAPGVQDPTGNGGGNIAPGAAPEPGAQGFSGGGGGNNGGIPRQKPGQSLNG